MYFFTQIKDLEHGLKSFSDKNLELVDYLRRLERSKETTIEELSHKLQV